MAGPERRGNRPSLFAENREEIRDMMGDLSPEQWARAQRSFANLRREIDRMQWFSSGPDSVSAETQDKQWNVLTLAPRDKEHQNQLQEILEGLGIYAWEETAHNYPVLIVENRRDIALLRAALIFDYLASAPERHEREQRLQALEEERQEAQRVAREKLEAFRRWQIESAAAPERKRAELAREQQRLERMKLEGKQFHDKQKAEKEALVAAFFLALPRIPEEELRRPTKRALDQFYSFPYPNVPYGKATKRKRGEADAEPWSPAAEVMEIDTEWGEIEQAFTEGRLNEDSLIAELAILGKGNEMPTLKLFPTQYRWVFPKRRGNGEKGYLVERESGRMISDDEQTSVALKGKENARAKEAALRELVSMHRALILWMMRKVMKRSPHADPDELFQEGVMAISRCIDKYEIDHESGVPFKGYAMYWVESRMRRSADLAKLRSMHAPVHLGGMRKQLLSVEDELQKMYPERKITDREIAQLLFERGVIPEATIAAYDIARRRAVLSFQQISEMMLDGEEVGEHTVSMSGEPLVVSTGQQSTALQQGLRDAVRKALGTLTPREERIISMYFELHTEPGSVAQDVYGRLSRILAEGGIQITEEELAGKIRALTAAGSLTDTNVLAQFSSDDYHIASAYVKILKESHGDTSLEDIGESWGITHGRVGQIINKALRRLKHPSRGKKLADFANYKYPQSRERSWLNDFYGSYY